MITGSCPVSLRVAQTVGRRSQINPKRGLILGKSLHNSFVVNIDCLCTSVLMPLWVKYQKHI